MAKKQSNFVTLEVSKLGADIIKGLVSRELLEAQISFNDAYRARKVALMDQAREHALELSKICDRLDAHA